MKVDLKKLQLNCRLRRRQKDTARVLRIKSTLDVQEAKSVTFHASSNKGITVRRYQ